MENTTNTDSSSKNQHPGKKVKTEKLAVLKKLDPDTGRTLKLLKEKINKKSYGRSIRDTEIISLALTLVSAEHIQKLQDSTLNEQDHLRIAHEDYVKVNGKITLNQFIGLLIRGQLGQKNKNLEQ